MEEYKLTPNERHSVESSRQYALDWARNFTIDDSNYKEKLEGIINANQNLRKGLNKYGLLEESLASFDVRPWGAGNLDRRSVITIADLTNGNKDKYPNIEVLRKVREEWVRRTGEILSILESFNGSEEEAFDLIQKLHKEKILEPLNNDSEPLMV